MKKEYIINDKFTLAATEQGSYREFDLSVAVAIVMGWQLVEVNEMGDALLEKNERRIFVIGAPVRDEQDIKAKEKEYDAFWFTPLASMPIAQEIMATCPMILHPVISKHGALVCEWMAESNTIYGAGNIKMVGLLSGRNSWNTTASTNPCQAITINALKMHGVESQAVFNFPGNAESAQLVFVTNEVANYIRSDARLSATCVFAPELDKFAIVGAPKRDYAFELKNAQLAWEIQINRYAHETNTPISQLVPQAPEAPAPVEPTVAAPVEETPDATHEVVEAQTENAKVAE